MLSLIREKTKIGPFRYRFSGFGGFGGGPGDCITGSGRIGTGFCVSGTCVIGRISGKPVLALGVRLTVADRREAERRVCARIRMMSSPLGKMFRFGRSLAG